MKLSTQKAFTLIEILLVTSIISLLSTVVVNESKTSRLKADDAHMKTESHQLVNAINLYKNDNKGKVPVGNTQINAGYPIVYENDTEGTRAAYIESMQKLVDGGYIPEIPTSPSGESYSYYVTENEDKAMFAAKLNFESSNSSSKNSCEFFGFSQTAVDCIRAKDQNFQPIPGPEGWIWYDTSYGEQFCNMYGDSSCYPEGDGSVLNTDIIGCEGLGFFGFNCVAPLASSDAYCPPAGDSVCDGTSKSDYCSCI